MQSLTKVVKRASKRVRGALGQDVSSDSDSDDEFPRYNSANDTEARAR